MQDPFQRRQVEDVLQALAVGLEHDRERAVLACNLEQALSPEALLPERGALAWPATREQQRARSVLAEPRPEERRLPHLLDDQLLHLAGGQEQVGDWWGQIGLREVKCDPVVRPDRLCLDPKRVTKPGPERHRPRRVDAGTERRQDAEAPVADLVAEPLDDNGAVGGDDSRIGRCLVTKVRQEVLRSERTQVIVLGEARERLAVCEGDDLAGRTSDLLAQLERAADALSLPERDGARSSGRRGDEHAIARDLLDPPRRGPEHEGLALPRLVHHLLVELPDAPPSVDLKDTEEATVGDRPGVRHRQPPCSLAAPDDARCAIPHDAGSKLGKGVRRIAPREHVEHILELRPRQVGERVGSGNERVEVVDGDLLVGTDRNDLLCEYVEWVPRDLRLLDRSFAHRLCDDGRLEQVGAELGKDTSLRDGTEVMPRTPDSLQPARHGLRALDLDHKIDCSHVDPELERRGRHEARDLTRLQQLFDLRPLLTRERAVVRPSNLFLGKLVQPQRQSLGEASIVDEHDRRAMLPHEVEQGRVDRRPDRARGRLVA